VLAPILVTEHSHQLARRFCGVYLWGKDGTYAMKGPAPADETTPAEAPRSARLNVSSLRRAVTVRMWGGKGSGVPCDFCRVLVGPADVECEVEARLDGDVVILRFHQRCHDAWKVGQEPASSGSTRPGAPSAP
jgi:hypothetical protein